MTTPHAVKVKTQLDKIKQCEEMINECKLQLVQQKIGCESSLLEYMEKIMQNEENKLNQYLRSLTNLHHHVTTLDPDQSLYDLETKVHGCQHRIKQYQKDLNHEPHTLFSTVTVEWLESSINLQQKWQSLYMENEQLKSQLTNLNEHTLQINEHNIEQLQSELNAVKAHNQELQQRLDEQQTVIDGDMKQALADLTNRHAHLKNNTVRTYKQCLAQILQLQQMLQKSQPINLQAAAAATITMQSDTDVDVEDDEQCIQLLQDIGDAVATVIAHNTDFIAQQNKMSDQMKLESQKVLQVLQTKHNENEKIRDAEIKQLLQETRENLERQYGEYNQYCDSKVERIKKECMKYREQILIEAKQQIKEKKKYFETAKNVLKEQYEKEMIAVQKKCEEKTEILLNDILILETKLGNAKHKFEQYMNEKLKHYQTEFVQKIDTKEQEIAQRLKMIEMRYEMKVTQLTKKNEVQIAQLKKENAEKIMSIHQQHEQQTTQQQRQHEEQQQSLQNEIDAVSENFRKEIQALKRLKPHHIVHVPMTMNHQTKIRDGRTYSYQLEQYLDENDALS